MHTHRQHEHDNQQDLKRTTHKGPDVDHERGKPGRDPRRNVEREHDVPDENGEPPSVRRGGNPEASEPPVENT
jgi:hypothetical protein